MGRRKKLGSAKDIKTIKAIAALMKNPTIAAAYKATHPHSSKENARKNGKNMLTLEVIEGFKKAMGFETFAVASRSVLEKVLFTVVARWYAGEEGTQTMIQAVKELTRLVPDFSDKIELKESDTEDEIDTKLKALGIDPKQFERN